MEARNRILRTWLSPLPSTGSAVALRFVDVYSPGHIQDGRGGLQNLNGFAASQPMHQLSLDSTAADVLQRFNDSYGQSYSDAVSGAGWGQIPRFIGVCWKGWGDCG